MELSVKFDVLVTTMTSMNFELKIQQDGTGHLQIYVYEPRNSRKSGSILVLGEYEFGRLKEIIAKIDDTINELKNKNQVRQLKAPY